MAANKELKDAIKIVSDLISCGEAIKNFGILKVIPDLKLIVGSIIDLKKAVSEAPQLFPEWKALDDAGRADLVQYVKDSISVPENVNVENYIENALEAVIMLSQIV